MVKKGNIHNFCLTMCYVLGKIEDSNNKTHFPTVMNQRISGLPWLWELLSSHYLWLYHAWLMSWIRSERASVAEEAVLRLSIEQGCMFNEDNCRVSVRDTKKPSCYNESETLSIYVNFTLTCNAHMDMVHSCKVLGSISALALTCKPHTFYLCLCGRVWENN